MPVTEQGEMHLTAVCMQTHDSDTAIAIPLIRSCHSLAGPDPF